MSPPLAPLLMWAGGKSRLLRRYAPLMPADGTFSAYVEPFLGGGALFAFLRSTRAAVPVHLGDCNIELMALYQAVRDQPHALLEHLAPLEAGWARRGHAERKIWYYELRERYWTVPGAEHDVASAAMLLFLVKTGFNGIWQTCLRSGGRYATPIGLANQRGAVVDRDRLLAWSTALSGVVLAAQSYERTEVPVGAWVFADPPYRGGFTTYATAFDDAAQMRLVAWCRETARARGALVWLSNRETGDGFWGTHAADAQCHAFSVTYTAGRRKRVEGGFEAKAAQEILLIWDGRAAC